MMIAHRLVALSAASAIALAAVGVVGVYGVRTIQRELNTLTSDTMPLKNALLELQEGKERTFGKLSSLSYASSQSNARLLREEIDIELVSLGKIVERIDSIDNGINVDIEAFKKARHEVVDTVSSRLNDSAAFKEAAQKANHSLSEIEQRVTKVSAGVQMITKEANRSAHEAQQEADALLNVQRNAQHIDSLLSETTILVYATDALTSKFRIGPLRERFIASIESLEHALDSAGPSSQLISVGPNTQDLRDAFVNESNGLFAQRLQVLSKESGAKKSYKTTRSATLDIINSSNTAIRALIDDLEFEIVLKRRSIAAALALSSDPASVTGLNQRLLIGEKDLSIQLQQLMLAENKNELAIAAKAANMKLMELVDLSAQLARALEDMQRMDLKLVATGVTVALKQIRESINAVQLRLSGLIEDDQALSANLAALDSVAEEQRDTGRQQITQITKKVADVSSLVDNKVETATFLIIGLSVLAAILSVLFSVYTIQSIVKRLRLAVEVARAVASGRLDPVTPCKSKDEISYLLDALSNMVLMLDGSVRKIRNATSSVNFGAEEISSGNSELCKRTEQQANYLTETAGSTVRISDAVKRDAIGTQQASSLAATASDVAGEGREVVNHAMESMRSIEEGAKEISNITTVIDALAFQTNILALNAAVEASRAGESGRSFAVVAAEVRLLAQKSTESANQIKSIIDANVKHVESGSELVRQAGQRMDDVSSKVDEVAKIISDVSDSSSDQVDSISQINKSVIDLESMTQQNAAVTEQTSTSAENLLLQSRALDDSVSVFSLPEVSDNVDVVSSTAPMLKEQSVDAEPESVHKTAA